MSQEPPIPAPSFVTYMTSTSTQPRPQSTIVSTAPAPAPAPVVGNAVPSTSLPSAQLLPAGFNSQDLGDVSIETFRRIHSKSNHPEVMLFMYAVMLHEGNERTRRLMARGPILKATSASEIIRRESQRLIVEEFFDAPKWKSGGSRCIPRSCESLE